MRIVTAICVQGRLILDKPYPFAAPQSGIPFCKEFQECSCCNSSHVLTIRNDILHFSLDESISPQCLRDVEAHSCSVCDPWVCGASSTSPCCANGCSSIGDGLRFCNLVCMLICKSLSFSRARISDQDSAPCHHMPHSLAGRYWWTQIVSAKLLRQLVSALQSVLCDNQPSHWPAGMVLSSIKRTDLRATARVRVQWDHSVPPSRYVPLRC